jgi:hypothetical protein
MMLHDTFLLQQLSELTEALHRPPARRTARTPAHADEAWSEEDRRRLMADITARRAAGESFGCIAHALNERGERGEHGGRWYGATVRRFILRTQAETR